MGIVESILAEFQLSSGSEYRVEYNESGRVHIHVNSFTIVLTPAEFLDLVDLIEEAHVELENRKGGLD